MHVSLITLQMGETFHTWKKRHFTVTNYKDNFTIIYSSISGKLKGRIYLAGYTVMVFTKEEEEKYGHWGIKLSPLLGKIRNIKKII